MTGTCSGADRRLVHVVQTTETPSVEKVRVFITQSARPDHLRCSHYRASHPESLTPRMWSDDLFVLTYRYIFVIHITGWIGYPLDSSQHTHTHCRYAFWINKMSNNIYVIILFVNDKRRDWEEWGLWLLGICKIWQIHILNECDVCRWRYTCAPVRISMRSLYTEKKKRKEKDKTCCYHLSFSSKWDKKNYQFHIYLKFFLLEKSSFFTLKARIFVYISYLPCIFADFSDN